MRYQEPNPKEQIVLDIEERQALLQDEMRFTVVGLVKLLKLSRTASEATEYSARLNEAVVARTIFEKSIIQRSED